MIRIQTKRDTEGYPQGVWYDFNGAKLKIRQWNTDIVAKIERDCQQQVLKDGKKINEIDNQAFESKMTLYLLQDYEGFIDDDDNPLLINNQNKHNIMSDVNCRKFIYEKTFELQVISKTETEAKLKNSVA
jgi:hypothetical protein